MSSPYGPLCTPDEIEDELLATLRARSTEYLAELERTKGLEPNTIPVFQTIGRFGAEGERQPEDYPPALLLGVVGTAEAPTLDEERQLDFTWAIGVALSVTGVSRSDAGRAARWYAMAVAQLLLQATPRNGVIQALRLRDAEFTDATLSRRRTGFARLLFHATSGPVLTLNGPLQAPADPYAPPAGETLAVRVTADIDKEPL
jgi:hypothetical protein